MPAIGRSGQKSSGLTSTDPHLIRGERVPVVLLLDVSASMAGAPMRAVNAGYGELLRALNEDASIAKKVDISVITFSDEAKLVVPFAQASTLRPVRFATEGMTSLGPAINLALSEITDRTARYAAGGKMHQPWIFIFTDGKPSDPTHPAYRALRRTETTGVGLHIFPIGVGDRVSWDLLNSLSATRDGIPLRGLLFKELFQWLADELGRQTREPSQIQAQRDEPKIPAGLIQLPRDR